ncbi:hypothetical protein F4806DRAFT_76615 [Annulohypoxylon nitens]|nr:hypothetical protein F4806DRAFT_76615 [Annulohypoxylon nitens]
MARFNKGHAREEALPAYSDLPEVVPQPSTLPEVVRDSTLPEVVPQPDRNSYPEVVPSPSAYGPTVNSPFNFPSDSGLPAYSFSPENILHKPIVIPQIAPDPKAPLLDAYSEELLRRGITPETWAGFLTTLSGFLAATVSEKAISHAAQMARHVGEVPKRFGKETIAHAKSTGRAIADSAKKGNFIGAATHTIIGGGVWLPVATAVRAVGAAVSLPFAVLGATVEDPKTPKERAEAYALAANAKWLHRRGLEAHLLETGELAPVLGLAPEQMLAMAKKSGDADALAQLGALGAHVAEVRLRGPTEVELGALTFWLVITQKPEDEEVEVRGFREMKLGRGSGRGRGLERGRGSGRGRGLGRGRSHSKEEL